MEVINLQIGNCGIRLGTEYWKQLNHEHLTGQFSSAKLSRFFKENENSLKARSILVDLKEESLNAVKAIEISNLYDSKNYVNSTNGSGGNWCKGHYTDGDELIGEIESAIRKEVEKCEKFSGFQVLHSIGGGTGGGLGTLVIEKLKEFYCSNQVDTFSVFYKTGINDRTTEPYNAVLSINSLINCADITYMISNHSVFDIAFQQDCIDKPMWPHINAKISRCVASALKPLRIGETLLGTIGKYLTNLVMFPTSHFVDLAFFDINKHREDFNNRLDDRYSLGGRNSGKIFSGIEILKHGFEFIDLRPNNIDKSKFVDWVPDNFKSVRIDEVGEECSAILSNGSGCCKSFRRIMDEYKILFNRKAFIHWYTGEGMDSMEFESAQGTFEDLIENYEFLGCDENSSVDY